MAKKEKPGQIPGKGQGELRPGPRGGMLRTGGTSKGGTGRPPDEFKARMRERASRADVEAYLEKCLNGEFGPRFYFQALQMATEYGYGKPQQTLEVTGKDGAPLYKVYRGIDDDAV